MAMFRDQNAGRSHKIKTHNSPFESVEQFKYLGIILINKNSNQEEIKSRLKTEIACYRSVQNLLFSSLLSNNIKIKIRRTIIQPVVLYGCQTWPVTLWEEPSLSVFENRVLWRIWGPKKDQIKGSRENYTMRSLLICAHHQILFG